MPVRTARAEPPSPGFAPTRMVEVELSRPLPLLHAQPGELGIPYRSASCLVRLHGRPLGLLEIELPSGGLTPEALAARIEGDLGEEVARHLIDDGLVPRELTAFGLQDPDRPPCTAGLAGLLSRAPIVSVLICTRNHPESVRDTVSSVLRSHYPADRFELIVVDNASAGESPVDLAEDELVGKAPVRVVQEPEPGLANARNKGLREASGEIVVFADDDVEVDRYWLATLVGAFGRGEWVGAVSGMTLPGALETPVQRWVEGFGGRVRGFGRRVYDIDNPPPDQPLFPFTLGDLGAGRNMAFRRELLMRLGGFDPALGPPGELVVDASDIDALLRVLLSGLEVVHDPAAIVRHAHPREYPELERRVWGYGAGLTACLTKALLRHPRLLGQLLRKLPRGLAFALSSKSDKNAGRQRDFPASLVRLELRGMAHGPIAYARSSVRRRRRRRHRRQPAAAPTALAEVAAMPSSLRVLAVTDEYRPVIGGAARNIELLARQVSRLGHTVEVATAWQPGAPAVEEDGGIRVHRIRDLTSRIPWLSSDPHRHHAPPFPDPEAVWRLRRLIKDFEPDLVHAYGWLAHSAAAALLGKKIPLLVSAHDYGNFCAQFTLVRDGERCSGPAPAKCLSCAASSYGPAKGSVAVASVYAARPLLRRKISAVHSVSQFVGSAFDRALRIPGVTPTTIPNFHQDEAAEEVDLVTLASLPAEPFILFVGHLRGYKGLDVLLAAYEKLEDPPPLVLVGTKGADTPQSFPPGVSVHTYVPHATVMAMWRRALFGVSPSIAPEAFPTVVHEAMSKGRAMIGTRPGGYEEMIEDGETGLLVPPGDSAALAAAMRRLIDDEALRERIGRRALEQARRFKPEAVMPRVERLYYDTVARSREARR
jgi:glycosyltransferase involved in cell wall biosynthesis/GT2 family glycosyltransferase